MHFSEQPDTLPCQQNSCNAVLRSACCQTDNANLFFDAMTRFLRNTCLALCLFLAACYTVPETGRTSLNLMPEGMLTNMALQEFNTIKSNATLLNDPARQRMVQRVGERVIQAARQNVLWLPHESQWEFVVFDDDDNINAFALPGGRIGVYSGLFKVAETEDELAVVMAHEVAHVVAKHGNERVSQALAITGGALVAGQATKDMDDESRQAIMMAYGIGATYLAQLPYSRLHESEADKLGLKYMARAGYNPEAALGFWEKMKAEGGARPPEFLSTHPAPDTRIRDIRAQLPEANRIYQQNK